MELSNYLQQDQAATFAGLRAEGLIDVEHPDRSKILEFISRRPDKPDPLIEKVRQAELQAFQTWLRAATKDPLLLAAKAPEGKPAGGLPVEVIRHVRRDRVVASFEENIWLEIGRCVNCHSPERNQRLVRVHGDRVSWIVPGDAAATLKQAVDQGIIDTDAPEKSLILEKPLALVKHGGGPKFALGSRTDKNFRRFLNDYAAIVNEKYLRKEQLPTPSDEVAALSGQHLRITNLPASQGKKLLRVDVFAWTDRGWSAKPAATAENPINGAKGLWQSMIATLAPRGSQRAKQMREGKTAPLPAGKYLVRIFIDRRDKAKHDRDYQMGPEDFYGEVEIDGRWPAGYQPPKIIEAPKHETPK